MNTLFPREQRAFGYAMAASLALHAALLVWRMPIVRESLAPPPSEPLVTRLVEPAPEPKAEAPAPVPPQPQPRERKKREPTPTRVPQAVPVPVPATEATPPPPPSAEPPAAAPAPALEAPAVATLAPAAPPVDRPDTGSIAQYRQTLIGAAARYKRYPVQALDNGWEGSVVVRVSVPAGGGAPAVSVRTGSGHEILDRQAVEMFTKAAAEVAVPPALRGRDFTIDVRAIYNVKDQPSG